MFKTDMYTDPAKGKWAAPGAPGPHPMMKGALLSIPAAGTPKMVRFQYNPESVTRSLKPSFYTPGQGQRFGSPRFSGAATQSIQLEILIDGTDGLDRGDASTKASGIRPQLAALELLANPSVAQVKANKASLAFGVIEALPIKAPRLLMIFGSRVLPVRLSSLEITEEFFDNRLNPIRARVKLGVEAVTYSDVFSSDPAWVGSLDYQRGLETTAGFQGAAAETALGGLLGKAQDLAGEAVSAVEDVAGEAVSAVGDAFDEIF